MSANAALVFGTQSQVAEYYNEIDAGQIPPSPKTMAGCIYEGHAKVAELRDTLRELTARPYDRHGIAVRVVRAQAMEIYLNGLEFGAAAADGLWGQLSDRILKDAAHPTAWINGWHLNEQEYDPKVLAIAARIDAAAIMYGGVVACATPEVADDLKDVANHLLHTADHYWAHGRYVLAAQ